jgi:hypothetical protein
VLGEKYKSGKIDAGQVQSFLKRSVQGDSSGEGKERF